MYTAVTPNLAAAVTKAGGFGLIPAGGDSSETIRQNLSTYRKALGLPDGVPVPTGVGFLGWLLDKTEVSDDPRIPAVLEELPMVIWFAFGDDLGRHITQVRAYDKQRQESGRYPEHKTLVFVIVSSVEDTLKAINEWHVDVIVLQGTEAGGHGSADAPSTFMLLAAVLDILPPDNRPPILAAGGITLSSQIAAALTMGADGVVLGTRLLFAHECMYTDEMKMALVDAGMNDTVRGMAFDEVIRSNLWPTGVDGRALKNGIWSDWKEGADLEERLKRYDEGNAAGEKGRIVIWAGAGIGMVHGVRGAEEIVRELHEDTVAALRASTRLLASI